MHISGTTEAYITIQLVTCTPYAWLPIIIYLGLIALLVDEIYYKHWKERKHCIGFVSHCTVCHSHALCHLGPPPFLGLVMERNTVVLVV